MKLIRFNLSLLGTLVLGLWLPATSSAMAPKPSEPAPSTLGQSYTWYDGAREQTVWLNPRLVAEFNAPAESTSAVRQARPGAQVVSRGRGTTRIWRVDSGAADTTLAAVRSAQSAASVSPVFHDSANEGGRLRALPGGVIVYLNPAWSETEVKQWAAGRGLEIVRKLEIGANVYLIKTAPGLASLETANALHKSGEVVAAMPEWWQEATTR
jgi:hypothetical protein